MIGYYVLIPRKELGEPSPGELGWDPDLHCPKYRYISIEMQLRQLKAEKQAHGQFLEDEPVLEPQMKAVAMIPTLDLIPPNGWWFDSAQHAEVFVKAVARVSDVSVDIVGKISARARLYGFLHMVSECRGVREEKQEGSRPLSVQERRDRHWRAIIESSSLARDFSPELVSHVTLMLVCASRALSDDKKGLRGSTDMSNKIYSLLTWFEENDKAALDEFDALHPNRDKNHPNHTVARNKGRSTPKNRGQSRNQGKGGCRRRRGYALPPGYSARGKKRGQQPQLRSNPRSQPHSQPCSQPLTHPHLDRRIELSTRARKEALSPVLEVVDEEAVHK